jgi:hypothetical protein
MRRKQASEYLFQEHGVSLSPATLAKLAVVGGGPSFRKDGPFPLYERSGLDIFATARLGPLRASTSDMPPADALTSPAPTAPTSPTSPTVPPPSGSGTTRSSAERKLPLNPSHNGERRRKTTPGAAQNSTD